MRRTTSSGVVPRDFTAAMMRDRSALENVSAIKSPAAPNLGAQTAFGILTMKEDEKWTNKWLPTS